MKSKKSIKNILTTYDFPHKFYVKYACLCARYSLQFIQGDIDERITNAITLAERFSNGENISRKALEDASAYAYAAASASAASTYATYAATSAASTYAAASASAASAASASAATYAATSATSAYAATSAAAASASATSNELKAMLLSLINTEFTNVEKILMGLDKL